MPVRVIIPTPLRVYAGIRYLAKENTPTKDGDTISIVPSIAGGCPFLGRCCYRPS